ncbi:MAG: PorT family protein [Bacteroidales bacterium]|nr:PorT family protein [Bacteroidales bacterium]
MRKLFKILFSFWFIILTPTLMVAQENDCAVNLQEAQSQFDLGQIEAVPDLLMECLIFGFTPEERIQAYKVLINAFIFDDNFVQAEAYCLEFMKRYPEYEVVATDPSEFVNLLNEFNNDPRSSIGVGGGMNFSRFRVIEPFGVHSLVGIDDGISGRGDYRSSGSGFQAGVIYNIYLGSNLEIGVEPMIIQNKYAYEFRPFDFAFVTYNETQLRMDIPLSMIWNFKLPGNINPYIRLGGKTSLSLSINSDSQRSYENTESVAFEDVTGAGFEIKDYREMLNYWTVFGGGIRYKISKAYFFIDLRYNLGLNNQVKGSSRNNGLDEYAFLYYYKQDDFYLDDFSISFGISKILYKPKRK